MEKRKHTVVLVKGTNETEFLANEAAGMQVKSNLSLLDSLISMMLTDEEAATLKASEKVRDVVRELPVEDAAYNTIGSPNYQRGSNSGTPQKIVANDWASNLSSESGEEYSPMALLYTGGATPSATEESNFLSNNYTSYGYYNAAEATDRSTSTNESSTMLGEILQNYAGEYVDIVAVEAGTPLSFYDDWHEDPHPDARGWGANSGTSRFVPMNWEDYEANLVSYNQVDNGGSYFSSHAIGVLSAAGGRWGGWVPNASLRVVYLGDGVAEAMNAVLAWHQSKPVNPNTGVRNATVVTGAWVYTGDGMNGAIPVDNIASIKVYPDGPNDSSGNPTDPSTVINRGDEQPLTVNYKMTANGSTAYRLEGSCRTFWRVAGTALASQDNPAISCKAGDTLILDASSVGSHPVEIIDYNTENVINPAWITGQGTDTITINFPSGSSQILKYRCTLHPGMVGTITAISWSSTTWADDFRPFVNANLAPRLITDPVDSTLKWMIPYNIESRETAFDAILDNYNTAGGIYYFQSAGNNSIAGEVGPENQMWWNEIQVAQGDGYVGISTSAGQYTFSTESAVPSGFSGFESFYPNRCFRGCYSNEITVSASQISRENPYLDGYSDRGPGIDISAPGSYTYGSYPVGSLAETDQNGYKWSGFGGTSCAGPRAAGAAAVMVDDFFLKRGTYPSIAQLKEQIQNDSKDVIRGFEFTRSNWIMNQFNPYTEVVQDDSKEVQIIANKDTPVYSIYAGTYKNGGSDVTDLHGNTSKLINVPWAVRNSPGKYMNHGAAYAPRHKERPASGNVFPRRKKTIEV